MITATAKLRSAFVFVLFCGLFGIALFHFYTLQIRQHPFFRDLGHRQYFLTVTQYPDRACLFDRNGLPLALNKESTAAFIMPHMIKDKQKLTLFLKKHFPQALEQLKKNPDNKFLYVKRMLTPEELTTVQAFNSKDIHLLKEPSRFYPHDACIPLIGLTSIDNKGLFGIEYTHNQLLEGSPAKTILEKDARSGLFYFTKSTQQESSQGTDLTLSIDSHLQFLVQEELTDVAQHYHAAQAGALVLNPHTGEVLALASYPLGQTKDMATLDLETLKITPLTESYEFGSALKAFCALAALEEGLVTPDELIDCENKKITYVDGRKITTVIPGGVMPFTDVLRTSNNIGIAKVAKRLDTKLYDHYVRMGFGSKTNIELSGENKGSVNDPAHWSKQSIISLSYGYELSATLLQLARAFSLLCTEGRLVQPTIFKRDTPIWTAPLYKPETIAALREILQSVTSRQGTGRNAAVHGYTTLGKTSTANLLEHGVYNKEKNIYAFVGSVEKGPYARVIACFIKESQPLKTYASVVAAPLFERIAEKTLMHEKMW